LFIGETIDIYGGTESIRKEINEEFIFPAESFAQIVKL
jgi:hypothetical protein